MYIQKFLGKIMTGMLMVVWSHFFSEDSPGGMGSKGKLVTHSLKHPAGTVGLERCFKGARGQPK